MKTAMKTDTVYFSVKGQAVIPLWLRKEFEIEEGTRAYVQSTPLGILIRPVTRICIKSLRGTLKECGVMKALLEDHKRGALAKFQRWSTRRRQGCQLRNPPTG
jgi:bifunctional DNA-binding transcriptional regulator/antitoxin component of YhaV-PrlF toxin-antitoxin module